MQDATWIRSYNSKNVYINTFLRVDGGITSGAVGTSGNGTIRATSFITSDLGFRISNAAANGTFLRGNGTNYVSSAIQASDIPSGSGNYIQNQTAAAQAGAGFWTVGTGRADAFGVSNTSSTTGKGFSFYGGPSAGMPTYGIMFAGVGTYGSHAGVNLDWATYLTMNANNSRGWIFKAGTGTGGNVASISGNGNLSINGRLRLGNSANTEFYSNGSRILVRAEGVDNVAQFAGYGLFLPRTGQTYNLYLAEGMQLGYSTGSPVVSYRTGDLRFSSDATERMRLTAAGNLGIGTTAPVQRLHVVGQIAINDNNTRIFEGNGNAVRIQTNSGFIDIGAQNTSHAHIYTDRATFYMDKGLYAGAGNALLNVSTGNSFVNGGNFGIGTTGPTQKLDVRGNIYSNGQYFIQNTAPTIYFQDTDHRSGMIHMNSNLLYFLSGSGNNSTTWAINGSYWPLTINMTNDVATFGGQAHFMEGNVGIGTTAPSVPLDINGAGLAGNGTYRLRFGWYSGSDPTVNPANNAWGLCGDPNLAFWRNYSYGYVNVSERDKKRDVHSLSDSHLAALMKDIDEMELAFYKYNEDEDVLNPESPNHYAPLHRLGTFTDAAPDYVLDNSLSGVNVYDFAALAMAGVKHLNNRVKALESAGSIMQETGSVMLANGELRRIEFELSGNSGLIPVISVTAIGESGDARVISKDSNGFTIRATGDVTVDWVAHHRAGNKADQEVRSNPLPVKTRLSDGEKTVIRDAFSRMVNTPELR